MGVHGSIVTGAPPLSSFCSFITSEKAVIGGSTPLSGDWEMKIDVSPRMKIRSQRLKPRIRVQSLKPTIETPNQMVNFLTVDLNFTFRDIARNCCSYISFYTMHCNCSLFEQPPPSFWSTLGRVG